MSNLTEFIDKEQRKEMAHMSIERQVAQGVFEEHRDRLITAYCTMIRLHYEFDRRNKVFPGNPFPFKALRPDEERDWCNAAVHILTIADETTQRFFLVADIDMKSKLVQCVIDDNGITGDNGTFIELPPV